jgi:cytochrome b
MPSHNPVNPTVRAWDPLVRVFHWSLVFFFLLAFVTEDDWLDLHMQAGYAVSFLIGFRLLWGVIGTRQARFLTFVKPPRVVLAHLKNMLAFRSPHYLGHNPVAAVMVIGLLLSVSLACFTGLVTSAGEGQGPLAGTLFSAWRGEWLEEIHEFFANLTLLLIIVHVFGVVFSSLLEGENLVKAMVTGRKKFRSHWEDVR